MLERIPEKLARSSQDHFVSPDHLKPTSQGNIGEKTQVEIVTECRENNFSLIIFEHTNQIGCYAALHCKQSLTTVNVKTFTYGLEAIN